MTSLTRGRSRDARKVRNLTINVHTPGNTDRTLPARSQEAENVLARTDHRNNILAVLLTSLFIAGAAGIGFTGGDATFPQAARWLIGAALAVLVVAAVVLASAIFPAQGAPGMATSGVPLYATLTPDALNQLVRSQSEQDYLSDRILTVSRIADTKHRRQRWVIRLFVVSLSIMLTASITAIAL